MVLIIKRLEQSFFFFFKVEGRHTLLLLDFKKGAWGSTMPFTSKWPADTTGRVRAAQPRPTDHTGGPSHSGTTIGAAPGQRARTCGNLCGLAAALGLTAVG